jgi:CRP-like cAMP-binding protein
MDFERIVSLLDAAPDDGGQLLELLARVCASDGAADLAATIPVESFVFTSVTASQLLFLVSASAKECPYLSSLSEDDIAVLAKRFGLVTLARTAPLLRMGQSADHLVWLFEGELHEAHHGVEIGTTVYKKGDFVASSAFVAKQRHEFDVVAGTTGDTLVGVMSKRDLRHIREATPSIWHALVLAMARAALANLNARRMRVEDTHVSAPLAMKALNRIGSNLKNRSSCLGSELLTPLVACPKWFQLAEKTTAKGTAEFAAHVRPRLDTSSSERARAMWGAAVKKPVPTPRTPRLAPSASAEEQQLAKELKSTVAKLLSERTRRIEVEERCAVMEKRLRLVEKHGNAVTHKQLFDLQTQLDKALARHRDELQAEKAQHERLKLDHLTQMAELRRAHLVQLGKEGSWTQEVSGLRMQIEELTCQLDNSGRARDAAIRSASDAELELAMLRERLSQAEADLAATSNREEEQKIELAFEVEAKKCRRWASEWSK